MNYTIEVGRFAGIDKPTDEQCEANEIIKRTDNYVWFAAWYPHCEDNLNPCVVMVDNETDDYDIRFWHEYCNGYLEQVGCDPKQLIHFGLAVLEKQKLLADRTDCNWWRETVERVEALL